MKVVTGGKFLGLPKSLEMLYRFIATLLALSEWLQQRSAATEKYQLVWGNRSSC